ncbi:AraC family transcriptional regulator [Zooshikella ganghwensis]|uniref:AraC family transcriptional regulator n=1 Tax=Zooshikella ganghwensis TaxID=202772 RepID=A0A4P9VJL4_9GAMM|nr:AraC family transcriptional regulator [Zooshikella ganghwensis]RDH41972.1 AraC family transcriptional regulator [Zooshikella ganghwensis]
MPNYLSIRAYSRQRKGHSHHYHQLVLPLRGAINIEVEDYSGKVVPGECVIIRSGEIHHFTANEEARFVVADMSKLPENISQSEQLIFSINSPLISYLSFIEEQLEYQVNTEIEKIMFSTFEMLLAEQTLLKQTDRRIRLVLEYVLENLAEKLVINELAKIACLSPTQFKKLFKDQMGLSVLQYITKVRMEKAKALLIHTDYPVQIVAEQVGYTDLSSFSRRFLSFYGLTPSAVSR